MPVMSLTDWIAEFARPGNLWYVKRLSGNDTLANKAHQAGPYIPKPVIFEALPSLPQMAGGNPRIGLDTFIDSHPDNRVVQAIWYNQLTRNEARITGWGGANSALLDPDSTGALAAFVFAGADGATDASSLHVWVCDGYEDEVIEDRVGTVEPGQWTTWRAGTAANLFVPKMVASCRLSRDEMPSAWLAGFPSGEAIIRKAVELRPLQNEDPDARLLMRRECEYELFRSVEEAVELPRIHEGFTSIDGFVERALTILQRRKARSGRSLELHAREILVEEGFQPGVTFSHSPTSEGDKKPDFLFPSQADYQNPAFPADRLRMLAAKTTLKDRWRQILNEANRVPHKHLLTLQEGVSVNQFAEMRDARVQLVVPRRLHDKYPASVQPHLLTVRDFLAELRQLPV